MRRAATVAALGLAACSGPRAADVAVVQPVPVTLPVLPTSTAATLPTVPSTTTSAPAVTSTWTPPSQSQGSQPGVENDVVPAASGQARASWYARGARTASGEPFEPDGLSFAHRSLAFGTHVEFCHAGRCVVARCNDRGPAAWTGRDFDLSRGAFARLAPLGTGVITVDWRVV